MRATSILRHLLMLQLIQISFTFSEKRNGVNFFDQESRPINNDIEHQIQQKNISSLNYLFSVYKMLTFNKSAKSRDLDNLQYFDVNKESMRDIKMSNTIISLGARNSKSHGILNSRNLKRLWFNTSSVPAEKINSAELKLYRSIDGVKKKNQGIVTISLYRIVGDRSANGPRNKILVDVVETTDRSGWMTFNVTESILHWVQNPKDNRGLLLEANFREGRRKKIKLEAVGILGFDDERRRRPFIVVYDNSKKVEVETISDFFKLGKRKKIKKVIKETEKPIFFRIDFCDRNAFGILDIVEV